MNKSEKRFQLLCNSVVGLMTIITLVPIILLVSSSFTSQDALLQNGYSFWAEEWSIEGYDYVFSTGGQITRAYGISVFITAVGTIASLIMTTMLAYGLSKKQLPFRGLLTFFIVFTMLFNGGLVPTYLMYTGTFQIKNTIWALLIPNLLLNAYNVMLCKSYFVTSVPGEILEAARIDGAGEFKTFYTVALPMAKPIIATIGMFVGIGYWNDWYNGYIYLTTRTDLFSIQNLLNRMMQNIQFLSQNATGLNQASQGLAAIPTASVRMAMAVLGVLPVVIIYPFIQNNFVKGITLGGVKG
jgi:putative aldouronate transport system permease protein